MTKKWCNCGNTIYYNQSCWPTSIGKEILVATYAHVYCMTENDVTVVANSTVQQESTSIEEEVLVAM